MATIRFGPTAGSAAGAPPIDVPVSEPTSMAIRAALGGDAGALNALHLPLLLRLARDSATDRDALVAMIRAVNRHDAIQVSVD